MSKLHLRIITPKKIVVDDEVVSVSTPTDKGEITVLPRHTNLFTLLTEGIIKIKKDRSEDFLAIGGGYLETDGKDLTILVSKAFGQDEIDLELTQKAVSEAKKVVSKARDQSERQKAIIALRRSLIDIKLLKKRKKPTSSA
jgi:F-type H+-transporting ATPase subunit epsilon